jgi:lysozyme
MHQAAKLEAKWAKLARQRRRQRMLFGKTKRRGNARKAASLGVQMAKLRKLIGQAKVEPSWKLDLAARFIAPWEGLLLHSYPDSGGIWTVGYGHTGSEVGPGQTITKARALALLASDLRGAAAAVNRNFTRPLSVRQRIAAISFAFNVGEGGLQSSTFLREFNAGNTKAAADALLLWTKDAAGNTLLGLQRRRRAERWLFLHPRKH